jgi:hypothetical protein
MAHLEFGAFKFKNWLQPLGPIKGGVFFDMDCATKKRKRARGLTSTNLAPIFDKRIQLKYQYSPLPPP